MDSPFVIKRRDLKQVAKAMHSIRSDKPLFSCRTPIFETLVDLKKVFEDVFQRAGAKAVLRKGAKKAFRPGVWVGYWWNEKRKGMQRLWIGCETELAKPRNGVKKFGVAFLLYDKGDTYDLVAYVEERDGWRENMMTYAKKDVNCGQFGDQAIKYWARMLK